MKKILVLFSFLLIISCESNDYNRLCDIINPTTINLVNPQYIDLLTPAGWAYANGGPRGLILYNTGSSFKAFSRQCPISSCANNLVVENDIKMVCPCDDAVFSILDGSPQTAGVTESVCEFKVVQLGSDVLNITNF